MTYFILIYAVLKLYIILDIYQQSHYHIKAYFKYFICNFFFYNLAPIMCFILSLFVDNKVVEIICGCYMVGFSLLSFMVKVKLKITKRIIRMIIISIIYIVGISFIPKVSFLNIFIELLIIPILYLDSFISLLSNYKYLKDAKNKISKFDGTKIIITGSYGKTSTKCLLNQVLSLYSTCKSTPKSYNTQLGVSKFINDTIIEAYKNIILEYGASKPKDISKLMNITKPDVAIVTGIGIMHMDGFKNIDNVIAEKMRLVKYAEVAILNYDNEYIRNYKVDCDKVISYGLTYGDYNARNIKNGSFDFYYKNGFVEHFDSNLIGNHQILNLLCGIAYVYSMHYDLKKIRNSLKSFKMVENRLEMKKIGNRYILDDSFNSNILGFKEALRVLSTRKNRILITPGIVELGKYKDKVNEELAMYIAYSVDMVILVGRMEVDNLYKNLKKYNIDIHRVYSYREGYSLYLRLIKGMDESTLLIENDLPDLYKRRLLI